jgi:hypothetical protein
MLIIQVIALLAAFGIYGHLAARCLDFVRAELAPRPRRYAMFKAARRA